MFMTTIQFRPDAPMVEVGSTLALAGLAVESLFGVLRVELETRYQFRAAEYQVIVDTSQEPGRALVAVFVGYVRQEFGPGIIKQLCREGSV